MSLPTTISNYNLADNKEMTLKVGPGHPSEDASYLTLIFGDVQLTNYSDCSAFEFIEALRTLAEAAERELREHDMPVSVTTKVGQ